MLGGQGVGVLTKSAPAWSLLLRAAEGLTSRGHSPFSRDQLLREVQRLDPARRDSSLGPVLQGLTANAPGGVPSSVGRPLLRVGRGLYRLANPTADSGQRPAPASMHRASLAKPTVKGGTSGDVETSGVVLIGCVKTKRNRPAPARELFASPLFARRLAYAESVRLPWFILSAKHALVEPDELLAPYDVYLAEQSSAYRTAWGAWVVERLTAVVGPLDGRTVEVHAGAAYLEPLKSPLARYAARVRAPLSGLGVGEQLAWYDRRGSADGMPNQPAPVGTPDYQAAAEVEDLVELLLRTHDALTPAEVTTARRPEWQGPGLYSWWVDDAGAWDLTAGLGNRVDPGLIYVGQAGATRWPSGRQSSNTLQGRLVGMHLGSRADFSTFRRTLGAALRMPLALQGPDDARLSRWMQEHLRVVVVPLRDGDVLGRLEQQILERLDPPLNLQGRPPNALRRSLSSLRRAWS